MSNQKGIFWGTGRRKTSTARVQLVAGKGEIVVNTKPTETAKSLQDILQMVGLWEKVDLSINVRGGGVTGQKEAMENGVAKALVAYDENLRPTLRKAGLLTRDPREKERKKYGLKKARRAPQWSKR